MATQGQFNPEDEGALHTPVEDAEVAELDEGLRPAPAPQGDADDDAPASSQETAEEAAELANAVDEAEREEIRQRRREERKARKQFQKDRLQSMERKLQMLEERNRTQQEELDKIHRMAAAQRVASVDTELRRAQEAERELRSMIADAVAKQDGDLAAEATANLQKAQRRIEQLAVARQQLHQQAQSAPARTPALDPDLVAHAQAFMQKHTWYKVGSRDDDSVIVSAIDNTLAAQGWDPAMPEYWQELEARAAKYLPHRFNQRYNSRSNNASRGPAVGGVGGDGGGGNARSNGYHLSAERVRSLKEAGMWEDVKLREKMIAKYKEIDARNSR